MKKIIIAIAFAMLTLFGAQNSHAQGRGAKAEMRIENRVQKMKENLNLTDDQATQVTNILRDARQKMKALKTSGTDSATMMAQRKEINKNTREQIKQVLSEEQRQKWAAMKKDARE